MKAKFVLILAVISVLSMMGEKASAAVSCYLDLRFDKSSSSDPCNVVAVANTNYTIDLWVRVVGTNSANDGLQSIFPAAKTQQNNGGIVTAGTVGAVNTGVGLTGGSMNLFWHGTGASDGNYNNISNDGLQDWGSTTDHGSTKSNMYATGPSTGTTYYVTNIADPNFVHQYSTYAEFWIGTLTFHVGAVNTPGTGKTTQVAPALDTWIDATYYEIAYPDGVSQGAKYGGTSSNYAAGSSVFFVGPTGSDSQILITNSGATASTATGASSYTIVNNTNNYLLNASVVGVTGTLGKTGTVSTSTPYTITASGIATVIATTGSFATGAQTANVPIGINTSAYGSITGSNTGTVVIHDAVADTQASGLGSSEGDDTYTVTVGTIGYATAAAGGANAVNATFTSSNALSATIAAGSTYGNGINGNLSLASKVNKATSPAGAVGTEAKIIWGTNNGASAKTVTMNWRTMATDETYAGYTHYPLSKDGSSNLLSDVVLIRGMDTANVAAGTREQCDKYVLSMDFDASLLVGKTVAQREALWDMEIVYLNQNYTSDGGSHYLWQSAVKGNFGTEVSNGDQGLFFADTAFNSSLFYLGYYGYDNTTHTVWAVLNYDNVQFAVPEPMTVSLLVIGGIGVMIRRRRRSRA